MSQFVIHRGLIISVIQAIFSICFYFVAIPVYNGLLMLGYATLYTNLPVFSLVLDEDVPVQAVLKFPPLYKTLQKGRSLSTKTFLIWVWKSIFQGCVIMLSALYFFNEPFTNLVTITFTALIITELLNVYSVVRRPIVYFSDNQTQLEDGGIRFGHLRLLHLQHCFPAFILRYFIPQLAVLPEGLSDYPSLMAAPAPCEMYHWPL